MAKRQGCLAGFEIESFKAEGENETFAKQWRYAATGSTPPDPRVAAGESGLQAITPPYGIVLIGHARCLTPRMRKTGSSPLNS